MVRGESDGLVPNSLKMISFSFFDFKLGGDGESGIIIGKGISGREGLHRSLALSVCDL